MGIKKGISGIALLAMLYSCTSNDKTILDQETSYIIPTGYKVVPINQIDVDIYKSFFNEKGTNSVALYRLLASNNYQIFLGIGINTTTEKLKSEIKPSSEREIVFEDSTKTDSFTLALKKDSSTYLTHYIRVLKSGTKFLFTVVSTGQPADSIFIKQQIETQLKIK